MPVILLYGIYGGVTTPTEAAAVAAFYALILAGSSTARCRWARSTRSSSTRARSSAAVGLVIGGALILNYVVASENIPGRVASALVGLDIHPLVFLLAVNVLILLLGCLLDATTLILVIIPLFLPACRELGIDLVHFGVVAIVNCMIGLITPPYGILLFVINASPASRSARSSARSGPSSACWSRRFSSSSSSPASRFTVEHVRGRVPVVASGHISDAVADQKAELRAVAGTGVDAVVLVTNRLAAPDDPEGTLVARTQGSHGRAALGNGLRPLRMPRALPAPPDRR
jgi:hypothetical protein